VAEADRDRLDRNLPLERQTTIPITFPKKLPPEQATIRGRGQNAPKNLMPPRTQAAKTREAAKSNTPRPEAEKKRTPAAIARN